MFEAKVLADSVSPSGVRLVTMSATYPRIIHSEFMTHRMFGRNSASTRAIPLKTQIRNLLENPFIPSEFGTNQAGMQPAEPLTGDRLADAVEIWLMGRDRALTTAIELMIGREHAARLLEYHPGHEYADGRLINRMLSRIDALVPKSGDNAENIDLSETTVLNVHKQLAGRGLETYMWHTVVFTFTEIENFLNLRNHPDAQGQIRTVAEQVQDALAASTPAQLGYGDWHTPFADKEEYDSVEDRIRVSAARCAAVSYNRQNAAVPLERLLARYDDLVKGGHMSPLEHQARPFSEAESNVRSIGKKAIENIGPVNKLNRAQIDQIKLALDFNGNLRGWHAHRKDIASEDIFNGGKG